MRNNIDNLGLDAAPKYHMDLDIMTYMHSFELDLIDQDIAQKGIILNVMKVGFLALVPVIFILIMTVV
jgi:hypothetical protein